jgi:hypothetical protein
MKIEQMRVEAQKISEGGDAAGAQDKLKEIEVIQKQIAKEQEDDFKWDEDLFKRVKQRSEHRYAFACVKDRVCFSFPNATKGREDRPRFCLGEASTGPLQDKPNKAICCIKQAVHSGCSRRRGPLDARRDGCQH